jgi:AraC-like DNA-binding protein
MPPGIKFGAMSIALLIFAVQALALAAALLTRPANRAANAFLAGLLIVLAGMLTPFVIGYAGFYDAFPWLSFAPFAMPLAVGPLLYGHVRASLGRPAPGWPHWLLPAAQFAYQAICFTQPLATKIWIDGHIQRPFLDAPLTVAIVLSMGGYALASLALLRGARRGTARRDAALGQLRLAVGVVLVLVAARATFDLYDAVIAPLDYFDLFAFYVLLALIATFLGIEGWRRSGDPLPPFAEAGRDWPALARDWEARLRREGWWRDPELDLAGLARKLGTNASYLSRGLNEGLGTGFAELLGAVRAEAVAARIDAGATDDLLDLALEAGFGSKASFNRAFARRFGLSPSAYRASKRQNLREAAI